MGGVTGGGTLPGSARIGPNAILQLVPVLDHRLGRAGREAVFGAAGVRVPPPDSGMVPEADVIRLHRAVISRLADDAPAVLREAGLATADYILAHRIPRAARLVIRALPRPLGARVLVRAIAMHAWTFAGSGEFRIDGLAPLTVSIARNPLAAAPAGGPGCHWHAAVFERLFATLVWPRVSVAETACCAAGDASCRFVIAP